VKNKIMYGEVKVKTHTFLTLEADGGESSVSSYSVLAMPLLTIPL
jgi:hypothetical protein